MLKTERQNYILSKIEEQGRVLVNELTKELNVTEDTIRKDLRDLSSKNLVKRVHGGALSILHEPIEYQERINSDQIIKDSLAEKAVKLIEDAKVIFIDGGTTNVRLASKIPHDFKGQIITNSPTIALELCDHPYVDLILLGGSFNKTSRITLGSAVLEDIKKMYFDIFILGISSIDSNYGITVPSYEESLVKKECILQSSTIISLVSSNKLEKRSSFFVGEVDSLDYLVLEDNANNNIIKLYTEKGVKII